MTMMYNKYQVKLVSRWYIQFAFNEKEAVILSQAEAVKDGLNYELVSVKEIKKSRFQREMKVYETF
jgi:hypothetical protein